MKRILIVMALAFFLVLSTGIAAAIPGTPNQYYGSVTNNNQLAPDGFRVTAKIDGIQVAYATTENGVYSLIVKDQEGRLSGKTVSFFVRDIDTGKTAVFCNGCIKEVNLAVNIPVPSPPDNQNTKTSGGSSGSSSPSSSVASETEVTGVSSSSETDKDRVTENTSFEEMALEQSEEEYCVEKWFCTEWSACEKSMQKRECIDSNKCGTDETRPFESQPCSVIEEQQMAGQDISGSVSTGFASFTTTTGQKSMLVFIVMIIVLALIIYVYSKNVPKEVTGITKSADTKKSRDAKKSKYSWDPEASSKKKPISKRR